MRYLDPYELFSIADPAQVDEDFLRKLRRRMMAEFELSNDGVLEWRGQAVDKSAATDLLDAMADAQVREHYWAMRQVPGLVDYLAGDDALLITQIQWPASELQPDLHLFVSGFLATQFNQQLGWAMENGQWPEAQMLLEHIHLLAPATLDPAFKTAMRWVHAGIIAMEEAVHHQQAELEEFDARPYVQSGLVKTLNRFPSALAYLRNSYAAAMLALAQMYANDDKLKTSIQVITLACNLELDEMLMRRCLDFNRYVLERQSKINLPLSGPRRAEWRAKPLMERIRDVFKIAGAVVVSLMIMLFISAQKDDNLAKKLGLNEIFSIEAIVKYFETKPVTNPPINPPTKPAIATKPDASPIKPTPDLYDTLRSQVATLPRQDSLKPASRHETGWIPYPQLLSPLAHKPRSTPTAEFTFQNNDPKDLVVFLELLEPDMPFTMIVASYYVRANSKLVDQEIASGEYVIRIFNGEEWRDSIGIYDEQPSGGFTRNVEFVGNLKMDSSIVYTRSPGLKANITGGHQKPTAIVYHLYELRVK